MNTIDKPEDPISRFSLNIFQINGLLMRSGDIITSSIDQSSARWQILGRIGSKPQTVAKIARDMGHARQSVQRVADVLVNEGLAIYKDHQTDRRTKLVELTPKGAEVLGIIYEKSDEWNRYLITKLDPEQLSKIADALENVGRILEKEVNFFSNGNWQSINTEEKNDDENK
ncbi:MarR family winged helix-turn-helix transcriptional regulator [Paenibacillus monticola]|uniref:MarR family transcriptional regulator n=1 Tax=Paenibacillus monticola TaxID=2666075 RepID=A0A7X2HB04_9BACL|nr:MarR family winged helix-turn-helix transcriptional regulator [Paenibacillus monticola]MRN56671.1 MarR family transcriptional regulator [Paenibacillus monticola]